MLGLDDQCTQQQFGDVVGISQQAVSSLMRRDVIADGETLGEWLIAYCDHLREVAAGRGTSDADLNLAAERAKLARVQRDRIELQNAVTRKELAPVALIEQVLAKVGARCASILDTIPGELRRRIAGLSSADIQQARAIVAQARNMAAAMSLDTLADDDGDSAERSPSDDCDGAAA